MKKSLLLLIFLSIISCQNDKEYHTVVTQNRFSLEIPSDMVRAEHLNDSASLQYQNGRKEIYVIVMDKTKKEFKKAATNLNVNADLDGFMKTMRVNIESAVSYPDFSAVENAKINGFKARQFSVSGQVDNFSLYYKFAFVEGKNHYYEIVVWTEKSRKQEANDKMQRIIDSFKELRKRG
ncbi:hypothetical protein [Flavobacterium sp. 3HN19-14]|uniref:hypothetical protein n=1 Tax=Flavobacterium sp. 3HN19-14 TaxID=3448133 RepID=UPI003EE2315D